MFLTRTQHFELLASLQVHLPRETLECTGWREIIHLRGFELLFDGVGYQFSNFHVRKLCSAL